MLIGRLLKGPGPQAHAIPSKKRWQVKLAFLLSLCTIGIFFDGAGEFHPQASSSQDIHIEPQPPFFSPNQLTITLGAPLTWKNRTQEPHTIVSDDCRFGSACSFDSGFIAPNDRFSLPPLRPGRYPYHCGIHPFMRGLITIHPPRSFSSSDI